MNIDVIVSWPIHLDFPLWRQFIHENRSRFNKVIVVFTQMNTGRDYRPFLREQLSKEGVSIIDNDEVEGSQDWRNVAVRKALGVSDAEWIWFTEQDFFPQKDFWDKVAYYSFHTDAFGYYQDTRLHPCCIFIRRNRLDQTTKDFSANPPGYDHFGKLQLDLEKGLPIGKIDKEYGHHYNGLSQNIWLLMNGLEPNYNPPEFKEYCRKCLALDIPIEPNMKALFEKYVSI